MTRRTARITHDEVRRMVKAVLSCGLPIGQVVFDGDEVRVVISVDSGHGHAGHIDDAANDDGLIREPQP